MVSARAGWDVPEKICTPRIVTIMYCGMKAWTMARRELRVKRRERLWRSFQMTEKGKKMADEEKGKNRAGRLRCL
jgi:hypothetical protein